MKIGDKVTINNGISVDGSKGGITGIFQLSNKIVFYRIFVKDEDLPAGWAGWNRLAIPKIGLIREEA